MDERLLEGNAGGTRWVRLSEEVRRAVFSDLASGTEGQHWRQWLTEGLIDQLPHIVQETMAGDKPTTMFNFSGPALKAILPSAAVYWPFAVLFPFVVCYVSSCPEGEHPFAHYPLRVWAPILAVVLYSMYSEWKALSWIIYTLARYLAPFEILGFRVRIHTWLMMMAAASLVTHLDVATNGLFLAKILKTLRYCDRPTTKTIKGIWRLVISESIMRDVPGFESLSAILLVSWGVMLFQPLVCFLSAYPLKGVSKTNYEPAPPTADGSAYEAGEPQGYRTPWLCCSQQKIWHPDALQTVATVNRMVSITDKALRWWLARGQEHVSANNIQGWIRAHENLVQVLDSNLKRVLLVYLLEKSWMLEAQTTIFAISRCLMPHDRAHRYDGQMLVALCTSFLTVVKLLYDMVDQNCKLFHFWSLVHSKDNLPLRELFRFASEPNAATDEVRRLRRTKRTVLRIWLWYFMTFVLLQGFFWHCLAKFIMAFVCDNSLWNIPFSNHPHQDWRGCVDVSAFLNVSS